MTEVRWTLATLLSHWRRHPLNFATLVIGLAIATALWSGVQALNNQARSSYDRAASVLGQAGAAGLVATKGATIDVGDYAALRRAGFAVSPVVEGTVRLGGSAYRLLGVEPLTAPRGAAVDDLATGNDLEGFLKTPGAALIAPETAAELGVVDGAQPRIETGAALPPLRRAARVAPGLIVTDIAVAQALLGKAGRISRIVAEAGALPNAAALAAIVGGRLRVEENGQSGDLARLTDSFHLNLTAFGFLAFVVGLFIVHASIGLAFEQRLGMVRTLRAVGVSLRTVMAVLVVEVLLLALIAGLAGMVCGYLIAGALLPNVAASLRGLYGAHVDGHLALEARWWLSGLAMACAGALAASAASLAKVARMPVLMVAKPMAWRDAQRVQLRRQAVVAGVCLAVGFAAYLWGEGLVAGFLVIAGVLLGAALLLPVGLAGVLRMGERAAGTALAQWFWADARQQLSGLSLALMALLLALSANIGVGTMVEGFRKTFTGWLDERLNSEVYVDAASAADGARLAAWLEKQTAVSAVLPVWRAETRIAGWPVDVFGTRDHETYRAHFTLLEAAPDAWDRVRDGAGVLVSEQLARRLGLGLGSRLALPTADDVWDVAVVGLYPDYGNPKGQVRISVDALVERWPDARRTSFSVRMPAGDAGTLVADLQKEFGVSLTRVADQASLKNFSMQIFERTFAVTAALNTLTLVVSGIALFASLLTLADVRLTQLAPVWALGVPRWRLMSLDVAKLVVLAAITAMLAVPLGLVLAWCLVAIVNVQAFGWRLPFHVFPMQWAVVGALAVATALVAALIPAWQLARTAPQDLLKVFANER